ncbi:MAG: ROK family protein [Clostridiales bacterium]|nr:ROK family protein [Clostridiales bacterium]
MRDFSIGVDLGGTNLKVGLVDNSGIIIDKIETKTIAEREYELILEDIKNLILNLIDRNNLNISNFFCVGIAIPGKIDSQKRKVIYSCNLPSLNNIYIEEKIKKVIDLKVFIENDAVCAALGENFYGSSKNYDKSFLVTIGTGIGGGFIYNKKNFLGTEIGHHVINFDKNAEKCSCGRKGCWEAYSSANALVKFFNREKEFLNLKIKEAKDIFELADKKDNYKLRYIIKEYYKNLATGLVNIINIFSPEILLIGGGISRRGENLLSMIKKTIIENVYDKETNTKIKLAKLKNDAGIIGASLLHKYF